MTEKNSPSVVKLAVLLMVICAVVSAVLGGVNMITAPVIAEIAAQKTADAYNAVLPTTGEYEIVEYTGDIAGVTAVATCEEGTVVEMSVSGSQSMLALAIGVDTEGAITGVSVIDHGETPGLGAKSAEPESPFRDSFIGQTAGMALDKKGGEVQALTGATITSQAIVDAANAAIAVAAEIAG